MSEIPTSMTVRRVLSPEDWKDKQLATLKAVGRRNYLVGIASPKRSPIAAGSSAESEERFNVAMRAALEAEARRKGVASSSDEEWFGYSAEIGADKIVDGVVKREAKVVDFIQSFQPKLLSHLAAIDKLPVSTLEERISKAAENIRGLSELHGSTKGR